MQNKAIVQPIMDKKNIFNEIIKASYHLKCHSKSFKEAAKKNADYAESLDKITSGITIDDIESLSHEDLQLILECLQGIDAFIENPSQDKLNSVKKNIRAVEESQSEKNSFNPFIKLIAFAALSLSASIGGIVLFNYSSHNQFDDLGTALLSYLASVTLTTAGLLGSILTCVEAYNKKERTQYTFNFFSQVVEANYSPENHREKSESDEHDEVYLEEKQFSV
ncbi:MAG: hypothetical protein SFW66_05345 [Gammaproteobacteria bacterium]|nr:hypothetical protein [Gammaproteobacteria bacterium]